MSKTPKTKDLVVFNEQFWVRRRDNANSKTQHVTCIEVSLDENQEMELAISEHDCPAGTNIMSIDYDEHQEIMLHSSTAYELAKRIIRLCEQYDEQVDYSEYSDLTCKSL